jgi:hypothetical protein
MYLFICAGHMNRFLRYLLYSPSFVRPSVPHERTNEPLARQRNNIAPPPFPPSLPSPLSACGSQKASQPMGATNHTIPRTHVLFWDCFWVPERGIGSTYYLGVRF